MTGFIARLGEKALGVIPVLTPVLKPLYGSFGKGLRAEMDEGRSQDDGQSSMALRVHSSGVEHTMPTADSAQVGEGAVPPEETRRAIASWPGRSRAEAQSSEETPVRPKGSLVQVMEPLPLTTFEGAAGPSPSTLTGELAGTAPVATALGARQVVMKAALGQRTAGLPGLPILDPDSRESEAELDGMLLRARAQGQFAGTDREQAANAAVPTVVRITIGQIHVRSAPATTRQMAPPLRPSRQDSGPTLADFLAKRPRATQ